MRHANKHLGQTPWLIHWKMWYLRCMCTCMFFRAHSSCTFQEKSDFRVDFSDSVRNEFLKLFRTTCVIIRSLFFIDNLLSFSWRVMSAEIRVNARASWRTIMMENIETRDVKTGQTQQRLKWVMISKYFLHQPVFNMLCANTIVCNDWIALKKYLCNISKVCCAWYSSFFKFIWSNVYLSLCLNYTNLEVTLYHTSRPNAEVNHIYGSKVCSVNRSWLSLVPYTGNYLL